MYEIVEVGMKNGRTLFDIKKDGTTIGRTDSVSLIESIRTLSSYSELTEVDSNSVVGSTLALSLLLGELSAQVRNSHLYDTQLDKNRITRILSSMYHELRILASSLGMRTEQLIKLSLDH